MRVKKRQTYKHDRHSNGKRLEKGEVRRKGREYQLIKKGGGEHESRKDITGEMSVIHVIRNIECARKIYYFL